MRRNMKLIHSILDSVEKAESTGDIHIPEIEPYSRCEVEYNVQLCVDAGFLSVVGSLDDNKPLTIRRMTWNGHEELDRSRNSS